MKMILCCNSCYKEDVIKNWFKKNLEIDIEIEKIDIINESLPRQPIGEDVKLICLKKINFLELVIKCIESYVVIKSIM